MTISSTANKAIRYGNGVATSFPYGFLIPNQSQLTVIVTDPLGNQMTLSQSQYSVSGIGSKNGGAVTYPLSGSPLAALWSVTILRTLPIVQQTDIVNQDGFYPDVLESAMDYQTMTQQQLSEVQSRSISFPVVDDQTTITPVLPAAAARATKPLIFDAGGNVTIGGQAYQEPQTLLDEAKAVAELLVGGVAPGAGTGMFLQNGVGAVARTFQDKQREVEVSMLDYVLPGETWVHGMRKALANVGGLPSGGTVVIPEGIWEFSAVDLIQDPTTSTSNYRYLFQIPSNVKIKGKSWKSILRVPDNCINSDSANQYCKGYQIFWSPSGTPISGVEFKSFKVDCNAAGNQISVANMFGNQAAGSVFSFGMGIGFDLSKIWIEGATGHQPMAFYLGTLDISIDKCRFANCGQTGTANANLTDHSSIYIEGSGYSVTACRFTGSLYDYVSTAIEAHGTDGLVTDNRITNYNVSILRAAMVSDSIAVYVSNNKFYGVSCALWMDGTAGRTLHVVFDDNQSYHRPFANSNGRAVNFINTAGGFEAVSNQTGNFTRLWARGNECFGSGANSSFYIGGFVHDLRLEDNLIDGYGALGVVGLHAHNGSTAIRRNEVSNMSGRFLDWQLFDAVRDAIDGSGTFPTMASIDLGGTTLRPSCAFTSMLSVRARENERITDVDISNVTAHYPTKPYEGIFTLVNTAFAAKNYQGSGYTDRLVAPLPVLTAEIRDIANDCTFFKQRSDAQLYVRRRGATAPTSGIAGAAFLGADYQGDIFEISQPTAGQPVTYYCTAVSGAPGQSGTWKAGAAVAA